MVGISIIICCFNSEARIRETIRHVVNQKNSVNIDWEIIIVDNASLDNTQKVSEVELKKSSGISYKIISQPEKGLARAREKGIQESKYDLIIFCDDDNHLDPTYMEIAYSLMLKMPEVGIIGGLSKPKLAYYPGKWIEDMYPSMAIGPQGNKDGYVNWVYGAGMVIRKTVYTELSNKGITFFLSGRLGVKQSSGEDAELCVLATFIGYRIYYAPSLILYHYMQSYRLKKSFFIKGHGAVYSIIYLWILGKVVKNNNPGDKSKLFQALYKEKAKLCIYFIPRIFLGKHKFYSYLNCYQSVRNLIWLLLNKKKFNKIYSEIIDNLKLK
jgi:glycosyltransferase involved in cell wall biosynthesis